MCFLNWRCMRHRNLKPQRRLWCRLFRSQSPSRSDLWLSPPARLSGAVHARALRFLPGPRLLPPFSSDRAPMPHPIASWGALLSITCGACLSILTAKQTCDKCGHQGPSRPVQTRSHRPLALTLGSDGLPGLQLPRSGARTTGPLNA